MTQEVDGEPVAQCGAEAQQQEAHAHVVKAAHLAEPAQPVKCPLAGRGSVTAERLWT